MDETEKMFRDDELRGNALRQAIVRLSMVEGPSSPQDIVNVAEIFYTFLKGETK
jgi:hypothetical protein